MVDSHDKPKDLPAGKTPVKRTDAKSALATSLDLYLSEINRIPMLTRDEEYALALKYMQDGDLRAAHQLVTANLRFVVKVAMQYSKYGVRLRDLIQEGNMGLMMAVKRYDPTMGNRLLSYGVWWIRAYIQKYILDTWSLVRVGTTQAQRKLFNSMRRIERKIRALEGSEPTDQALAEALDVREKDVFEMRQRLQGHDLSLNRSVNEADGSATTHLDLLPSEAPAVDEVLIREDEISAVQQVVEAIKPKLNKKERYILKRRLLSEDPETLQAIGKRFKISRERVRQIEENLKKKIKNEIEAGAQGRSRAKSR